MVTPAYRRFGAAILSWMKALAYAEHELGVVQFDHLQLYHQPEGLTDGHDIVTAKYQDAQRLFQKGDWDALVTLEDDMVIPEDGFARLWRLLEQGVDVAYGLYVWRHGKPVWSAYTELDLLNGVSVSKTPETARAAWGKVIEVKGVGLGFTAIQRWALAEGAIPFRRAGAACNDWYFAYDAARAGLTQACDLGCVCGHMTLDPSPRILWPDPDEKSLCRVEFL